MRRGAALLVLASLVAAAPAHAGEPDDLLQVTLTRLAAEAPLFGGFDPCSDSPAGDCDAAPGVAVSVILLDDGSHAEVSGDVWQISASTVKAVWMAAAVHDRGTAVVEPYAEPIFVRSEDMIAQEVIDLLGPRPSGGVDRINDLTRSWGMSDTFLRGWYGDIYSSEGEWWGYRNVITTDDLAGFWAALDREEVLSGTGLETFEEWAALPRPAASELIVPRLPAGTPAWHKTGWLSGSLRRIDGALIETPSGTRYGIALAFDAAGSSTYGDGGLRWARYASCEIYNVVAGATHACTRSGDPYSIRNHTAEPIERLAQACAEPDRLWVSGWALDRDAAPGPIDVRIEVDGERVGTAIADRWRPRIHEKHGLGSYHGFDRWLTMEWDPGPHEVCAVARNDSENGGDTVRCRSVTVPEGWRPRGRLGAAYMVGDRLVVRGRAVDRDGGPVDVKILVDGERVRRTTADRGPDGDRFRAGRIVDLPAGAHEICAIALDHPGDGPNGRLGCLTVEVT